MDGLMMRRHTLLARPLASPLTVSGPTPLLMPGALAKPLKKATFSIEPVQTGSGDPSPQNVRAIMGWTGANCYVTGENLFDKNNIVNGFRIAVDGRNFSVSGGNYFISKFIPVEEGATYIKNSPVADAYHCFATYTSDDMNTFVRKVDDSNSITIAQNEKYLRFCGQTDELSKSWLGSGASLSVEFSESVGTVYSGTIDPVTGEGVATHGIVDLGSLTWLIQSSDAHIFRCYPPGIKAIAATDYAGRNKNAMCEKFKPSTTVSVSENMLDNAWLRSDILLFIRDTSKACVTSNDAVAFKTYVSGTKLVYELATPIPFTVPPHTLTPPAGDAYIWADCGGSAEVTYMGKA